MPSRVGKLIYDRDWNCGVVTRIWEKSGRWHGHLIVRVFDTNLISIASPEDIDWEDETNIFGNFKFKGK